MTVFRTQHIPEDTVAVVPIHGYVPNVNYSHVATEWLSYLEKSSGHHIHHSHCEHGESKIRNRYVDGFCELTNTVYQFYGCFFHGCTTCNDSSAIHPLKNSPMWAIHKHTLEQDEELRRAGFNVVVMWEHEYMELKTVDDDVKLFAEGFETVPRLNPRDAFFGGRTGVTKMLHVAEGSDKIKYIDFTSLYPYVNKYCIYPVGHPEIFTRDFKSIQEYFGFALCKVLPPRGLYHPVLPYRCRGKLLFSLCRSCAESRQVSSCSYSNEERALTGTWTTLELQKAVNLGYEVVKMYEVYHFKSTSTSIFKSYVDTFLKIKQESSGWPTDCDTEEKRARYVSQYKEKEGIDLDPCNITVNPGKRTISKTQLNNLWGKFAENPDKLQTTFVSSTADFNKLYIDPTLDIHDVSFPNDEIAILQYTHKTNFIPQNFQTNIFIAAFTSHARLKLYTELEKLQQQVLYYDTDSIIYISNGQNDPPLGDYLGDFTDELDGSYITEFVAAGPKNYAYKTSEGKTCCKIRGFTLNYKNSQILNFNTLKDLITSDTQTTLQTHNAHKITRNMNTVEIVNRAETKSYGIDFDKRVVLPNLDTIPYGF